MESKEGESIVFPIKPTSCLSLLQPENLQASGFEMVLTQAVFAIAGAVALERGGGEANRIARERIIAPLGVRSQILEHPEKEQVE